MNILMLGNSFTYCNDMPGMLAEELNASVTEVVRGGAYLHGFLDQEDELSQLGMAALVGEIHECDGRNMCRTFGGRPCGLWDYVVIQEQSFNAVGNPDDYVKSEMYKILYEAAKKENADIALVRTKKANKMAVRRLKNAGKLMKENKKEEFYDEVLRALWGYLSDKLSIPQSDLTKDNVETELAKYGVDESLTNEFMDILNTCEFARYAPSQASDAMDKLYELTVDAIGKMENTIKK